MGLWCVCGCSRLAMPHHALTVFCSIVHFIISILFGFIQGISVSFIQLLCDVVVGLLVLVGWLCPPPAPVHIVYFHNIFLRGLLRMFRGGSLNVLIVNVEKYG